MTRKRSPHSGTSSRLMRTRRIAGGIPQLQAAVEAGLVTTYRAGEIAKLPAGQQQIAVAQWTSRSLCRSQGQAIAAKVIREELRRKSKVDLDRVAAAIRDAISQNFPGCPPKPSNAYRY